MSNPAERMSLHRHEAPIAKDKETISAEFRSSLVLIQSRPLNPDTIDTYAEDALADLINLSAFVTNKYREEEGSAYEPGRELEDTAFEYFHLGNLGEILTHVAAKDAEIKHIGRIVERAQSVDQILVPPDQIDPPNGNGTGEFKKKSVISRTKTLLFILSNDFDVDLEDPEQFSIKTGVLTDTMMRGLSYFQIEVPGLDRTILCCDEEGNVTYVFDNKVLKEHGITPDDISTLTKSDINDLLESDSKMGKRVVYSSRFVPKMVELISDLQIEINFADPQVMYLVPKAPEGVLTTKSLADLFGVDFGTIERVVKELGDSIGEARTYRFATKQTAGYTPSQQELIRQNLEKGGFFAKSIPEGVLPVLGIAKKLGLSYGVVLNAVQHLSGDLGSIQKFRFGSNLANGYSEEQQVKIIQFLERNKMLNVSISEDVLSSNGIAIAIQVDRHAVLEAIRILGDALGPVDLYRFGPRRVRGYTQLQQNLIYQNLESRGILAPLAPEGVLSPTTLAENLGISKKTLSKIVSRLSDSIGSVNKYKFHSVTTEGYSPQQQAIIEQDLRERGLISN